MPGGASATAAPGLARGAAIDRYLVLEPHGRGGMGEVYKAYDPQLDRLVALKLLSVDRGAPAATEARARMVREARALARLSHPNVVTVHDAGAFGEQVFIAMELVAGRTLGAWLAEEPREVEAIVAAFAAAGRGLAAAHAAGLVHRDFKPANVLVGDDGRVRVLDFGAARVGAGGHGDDAAVDVGSVDGGGRGAGSGSSSDELTRASSLVGTPGYMAPEQRRAGPVDARADQYGFCVALHEALYGRRPAAPADAAERASGEPRRGVPARLRRVIDRGLATSPAERFPSMDALLAALAPPRRLRTWWAAAAAVAVVVAAGAAVVGRARSAAPACGGARLALAGVWDDAARARVRAGLAAADPTAAAETWPRLAALLDGYTGAWAAMHRDACEAASVRGEQSAAVLDLRMSCLERRRRSLAVLVDLLAVADRDLSDSAVAAAGQLGAIADCGDVAALAAPIPLPADPAARRRVEAMQSALSRAFALHVAGHFVEAIAIADAILGAGRDLGYLPVEAEALHIAGLAEAMLEQFDRSLPTQERAAYTAVSAHDSLLAARAANELAWVYGIDLGRAREARWWAGMTAAFVDGAGGSDKLSGLVENTLGAIALDQGEIADGHDHFVRALALASRDDTLDQVARVTYNIGFSHYLLGRPLPGIAVMSASLVLHRQALGPAHPEQGLAEVDLASAYLALDDLDHGEALARHAYEVWAARYGPDYPYVGAALKVVAVADLRRGRIEQARAEAARASALLVRPDGPPPTELVIALGIEGRIALAAGEPAAAQDRFERALAAAAARGNQHASWSVEPLIGLADALAALGRRDEAMAAAVHALAEAEAILGPEHPLVADALRSLGRRRLEAGDAAAAQAPLERAAEILTGRPGYAPIRAEVDRALAEARPATE